MASIAPRAALLRQTRQSGCRNVGHEPENLNGTVITASGCPQKQDVSGSPEDGAMIAWTWRVRWSIDSVTS
jgi:hypothetical protein